MKSIIDTKWKNNKDNKPSTNDLRQMYVYNEYWQGKNALLLYPGVNNDTLTTSQFNEPAAHSCGLANINVFDADKKLDQEIGKRLLLILEKNTFIEK